MTTFTAALLLAALTQTPTLLTLDDALERAAADRAHRGELSNSGGT